MELNTRCPQCETVFPVALEQLQLRKGYIRCIQCAHIFDGFEAVVPNGSARPAGTHAAGRAPAVPVSGARPPEPGPGASRAPEPAARESRLPESRLPESRLPESRVPESRVPESRLPEQRRIEPVAPASSIAASSAGGSRVPAPDIPASMASRPTPPEVSGESPSYGPGGDRFIIPPPERAPVDETPAMRPFSIGPGRQAPDGEPAFHATAGARATESALQREPRIPLVVRERDAGRHAPPRGAPHFTIPDIRGAREAGGRAAGPHLAAPAASHGNAAYEVANSAEPAESMDDALYMEPRAGHRSRGRPELFDGPGRRRGWMTLLWAVLAVCGLALLLLQGVYVYRAQLANAFPGLRPTLEAACDRIGCAVPYERRIDAIAITGSALRSTAAPQDDVSRLTLEVTLRNTYERPQEWPTLVLDLKDASGAVVVRRNLSPEVWVPAEKRAGPFAADSEVTVQLPVSVRGLQANGYQLDKFFP